MQLSPFVEGEAPVATAGTLQQLADTLLVELMLSGYSLTPDDVIGGMVHGAECYAPWAVFEAQRNAVASLVIDGAFPLSADEWIIIQPLVRAYLDKIQAKRMESARSSGAEAFGLSVSEAEQAYEVQHELLPKAAFIEEVFSFEPLES